MIQQVSFYPETQPEPDFNPEPPELIPGIRVRLRDDPGSSRILRSLTRHARLRFVGGVGGLREGDDNSDAA